MTESSFFRYKSITSQLESSKKGAYVLADAFPAVGSRCWGHSSLFTTEIYLHSIGESEGAAMDVLEKGRSNATNPEKPTSKEKEDEPEDGGNSAQLQPKSHLKSHSRQEKRVKAKTSTLCKLLAEVHGNRTHLGQPSLPHTGFEVREPHQ